MKRARKETGNSDPPVINHDRRRLSSPSSGQLLKVYYIVFAVYAGAFFLIAMMTRGQSVRDVLFYNYYIKQDDYFMDYFNSIRCSLFEYSSSSGVIYPPFVNMFYFFLSRLLPSATTDYIQFSGRYIVRNGQLSMLSYVIYTAAVVLLTVKIIEKYVAKSSLPRSKALLAYTIIFSYPSIYCIERGNITMVAAALTLLFVMYRDSEKRWLRELSFIALAIAAAIKIYPAVFGVLLLFDKKYKDAVRLAIYGALFFFIPFWFYDGFASIHQFFINILNFSDKKAVNFGLGQVSVVNIVALFGRIFELSDDFVRHTGNMLFLLTEVLAVFAIFAAPKYWQKTAAITYFMINFPAVAQAYSVLFLIVPFLMFLSGREKLRKVDWAYLIVFSLFFIPLPPLHALAGYFDVGSLGGFITYYNRDIFKGFFTQINQYLPMPLLQLLLLMLVTEGIVNIIKIIKRKKASSLTVTNDVNTTEATEIKQA